MPDSTQPIWELREITKGFPGVLANDRVSVKLYAGEIHGLIGQNGCGKSTLIKILSGAHQLDSGQIYNNGQPVTIKNTVDARAKGVATVFQEFSLVPTLTVAENIYLGHYPTTGYAIDWAEMHNGAKKALESIHVEIDPEAILGDLSVAQQQLVEIAKAVAADASMIILDEPTTALGIPEIKELHALLREMKQQGRAILYISHRLDEIVEIVDSLTILKDGKVVSSAEDSKVDINFIVETMVGEDIGEHYPKEKNRTDEVLLEVSGVHTDNGVEGISFKLHRGEVLGLGGVLGSGRTEMARVLFGVDHPTEGEIRISGKPCSFNHPRQAIAAGIAYVTENRKTDGLFFNFKGAANITISKLDKLLKGWTLNLRDEEKVCQSFVEQMDISPLASEKFVNLLSGGNQQKIIISRWLYSGAEIFILDEPTQGIDVGAKRAIYELINDLTRAGKAVVLISSDHDELSSMSDHIAMVRHGTITDIVASQDFNKTDLVSASSGESAP